MNTKRPRWRHQTENKIWYHLSRSTMAKCGFQIFDHARKREKDRGKENYMTWWTKHNRIIYTTHTKKNTAIIFFNFGINLKPNGEAKWSEFFNPTNKKVFWQKLYVLNKRVFICMSLIWLCFILPCFVSCFIRSLMGPMANECSVLTCVRVAESCISSCMRVLVMDVYGTRSVSSTKIKIRRNYVNNQLISI